MKAVEDWAEYKKRTLGEMRVKWRKMKITDNGREERREGVEDPGLGNNGDDSVMQAQRLILRWRTTGALEV